MAVARVEVIGARVLSSAMDQGEVVLCEVNPFHVYLGQLFCDRLWGYFTKDGFRRLLCHHTLSVPVVGRQLPGILEIVQNFLAKHA